MRAATFLACLLLGACNDDIPPDVASDTAVGTDTAATTDASGAETADAAAADAAEVKVFCVVSQCPEDKDPCTTATCDANEKCSQSTNGLACDDGKACTTADTCKASGCAGEATNCDDGKPCSLDACDAATGECAYTAGTGACDDKNKCSTGDTCLQFECVPGKSPACDDGNACTDNFCDGETGNCKNPPHTDACKDDNPCTIGDACKDAKCMPGAKVLECDDKNQCTIDTCDDGSTDGNCNHTFEKDGTLCGPDNICVEGACK